VGQFNSTKRETNDRREGDYVNDLQQQFKDSWCSGAQPSGVLGQRVAFGMHNRSAIAGASGADVSIYSFDISHG
jgi:hypothetical protein